VLLGALIAPGAGTPIPHGTVELIAEKQGIIAAGHTFDVGLRFQLEKGWHVYWINPGDSGEPARVEWHLPSGLSAGAIEWPTPRRLDSGSIVDYGYEEAVLLIVPMRADGSLAGQSKAQIGADVRVLVCSQEMCIPSKVELSLALPIQSQPALADARKTEMFANARKSLPRPPPGNWKFSVADGNESFVLAATLGHDSAVHPITQAIFFPLAESQIENAAPQKLETSAAGFRLTLRKSDRLLKPIERLRGVLVLSSSPLGNQGYLIDVPVSKAGGARHAVQ
jgi:thiol:disulfide interchange protein DsbD